MTISCSKTFLISTLFILTTTIAFKVRAQAQAQPKENLGDKDFDVYVEPKDNPVYRVDSEFMHVFKRREDRKVKANIAKQYGVSKERASNYYKITHKEVITNGANFGIILAHDLKSDKKDYQIVGVKKRLIAIRCLGKGKSFSNALNTSCSKTVKKVFNLKQDEIESLFQEDPKELGSPLTSKKVVLSSSNNKAASTRDQKFFSNLNKLNQSANATASKNNRNTFRFPSKLNREVDACRDTTKWESVVVSPSKLSHYRSAFLMETSPATKPVRLYCKKANTETCKKKKSWLNYQEYLSALFGNDIVGKEVISTSQQTNFTNGKRAEKLCLSFKKD